MSDIHKILAEREQTHGDYGDHAATTQAIKEIISEGRRFHDLTPIEREALDMIAHKIGRILAGNPHYCDHWDDISGYATLVADRNRQHLT